MPSTSVSSSTIPTRRPSTPAVDDREERCDRAGDRGGVERVVAGDDVEQQRGVGDGGGERADLVERARERDQPVARDQAVRGLHADDAAQRGGLADRPAGVGAQGERRVPGGAPRPPTRHSNRRARAKVARVARRAERRVLRRRAHRELVEVGLGDRHRAGGEQALDDRRRVRRTPALEDARRGNTWVASTAAHRGCPSARSDTPRARRVLRRDCGRAALAGRGVSSVRGCCGPPGRAPRRERYRGCSAAERIARWTRPRLAAAPRGCAARTGLLPRRRGSAASAPRESRQVARAPARGSLSSFPVLPARRSRPPLDRVRGRCHRQHLGRIETRANVVAAEHVDERQRVRSGTNPGRYRGATWRGVLQDTAQLFGETLELVFGEGGTARAVTCSTPACA